MTLSPFTIILADEVEIGNDVYISPLVLIVNLERVKLGNRVYLSMGTIVRSHGLGGLYMGDFSATGLFCSIDCTCNVTIGKYSCLGPYTRLVTHGNFLPRSHGFSNQYAPVKIGDYVWIMMDVNITPGVSIGDNVIAHTGTTIIKDIPDNSIYTHARHNFITHSMNAIYKKTINEEYINRWKATLFSELSSFIKDYFSLSINCVKEDGFWKVTMPDQVVRIWDKDASGFSKAIPGNNDIIVAFKGNNAETMKAFCGMNWFDINLNLYNRAKHTPLFDYLMFYFEMKYGIYFTIYERGRL